MFPSLPTPSPKTPEEPRRLSDSPLFWFFVFGATGLLAAVAISPKHARRQERLEERMADSRQRVQTGRAETTGRAGDPAATGKLPQAEQSDRPDEGQTDVDLAALDVASQEAASTEDQATRQGDPPLSRSLLALMLFLAAVLAIAAAAVGMARYLRLAEAHAHRPAGQEKP